MKKRQRLSAKNSSFSQKYSHVIHERLPTKAKSSQDSKRHSFRQSYFELPENYGYRDTSYLKKDVFDSLESLFDIKKPLKLCDVSSLTYQYCEQKSSNLFHAIKSEPNVETLFLQSFSPTNSKEYKKYDRVKIEQYAEDRIKTNEKPNLPLELSKSAELQLNDLIWNEKHFSVNMAENETPNGEIQADEENEPINEDISVNEEFAATVNDLKENETIIEQKDEDQIKDETKDENILIENKTDDKDDIEESEANDKLDEKKINDQDKIEENDLPEEQASYSISIPSKIMEDEVAESEDSVITDDIIIKLKIMNERCIQLTDEIQELKREVSELLEKPALTEEDSFIIDKKQNVLKSKLAELEQLMQKLQKTREQVELNNIEQDEVKKDKEPFEEILKKDRFEISQIQYPEDKLPRIIVCGYTDGLPKLVVADTERKGREKCYKKLTGKLTESLTMQEKLVKENAQLEDGRYKLEEVLLEKDKAVESLQKKVCGLQAQMRIIIKENMELSCQLATLNKLETRPTAYTYPDGFSSLTSPVLSARPHTSTQHKNDVYCRCKCCLQSPFVENLSPTTGTTCNSPRLTGGGSTTKDHYSADSNSLQNIEMCSRGPTVAKELLSRGTCPAELEDKLVFYNVNTKQLGEQLDSMETEVHNMKMELANVQLERQQLEQQRKLLKCTGPCAPCTCCPPPTSTCVTSAPGLPLSSIASKVPTVSAQITTQAPMCIGSCTNAAVGTSIYPQQQLRDLREQYARLQDDYKSKLCEVSCMRTEAEKLKQDTRDAKEEKERMEIKLIDVQERLKFLEAEKGKLEGYKEHLIEQEQALMVAKQRFREAQDELEEFRSLNQDQTIQLEDYRKKYLQAQQQVEEQRRQLDLMEMDNARMNENVTLEIGRVKNQFQEKLAELAPLPDILKQMQIKMQEAQQMRLLAERNCEDLSRELLGCKDKIQTLQNQLDVLRTENQALQVAACHISRNLCIQRHTSS
ncbi:putative leucine-rich repeat-containing protein DDB_G0290503 isoform X2 [Cardiocondyla obscurior]|uniref:putative leucine-rich repeat-containing protein DDB_G0290503 isoform X2 n=1 Tax=Cardiocondyla obscurior TaxID=286306 RepID=UPI0039656C1F